MSIDSADVAKLLVELPAKKPIFCSEMDFQLHLAWVMKERGWELSLEYDPQCAGIGAIDILIQKPERIAIELKYKTALLDTQLHGESVKLKNQAAQDQGRYDFLRDIYRIEQVVGASQAERGFAIFLTNDSSYWRTGGRGTADERFRIFDGRRTGIGQHTWGPTASRGTIRGREKSISLTRDYVFGWKDYASFATKNGVFQYLLVEVDRVGTSFPTEVPAILTHPSTLKT